MAHSIVVASDHAGLPLKQELVAALRDMGHAIEDVGTHGAESVDYPDFAHRAAESVLSGKHRFAVLVGQVVLLEAGLNFLGLGDPQSISWGGMLNEAQNNLKAWWNSVPPGAMIFILVLTINLLGDAVNQYLRPVTSHV